MKQTILITGAGSGIGHDAAFALARKGYRVVAATETADQADRVLQEAKDADVALQTRVLDITDDAAITALDVEPDILIANAAIGESGPLSEIPLERVRRLLSVNIVGTIATIQRFVPGMIKKGSGRVIITGSTAGRIVIPFLGPYHMTKYAIEAAADALRMELRQHGIKVSLIEPGLIGT